MAAWACGEREALAPEVLDTLIGLAGGCAASRSYARQPSPRSARSATIGRSTPSSTATADRPAIRRRAVLALAPFVDPAHARADDVAAALERARSDHDWQVRQSAEDILP